MSDIEEIKKNINWITFVETSNIINQIQNKIYTIKISDEKEGIGFFTKFYFPIQKQYIQVLITNYIKDSLLQNKQKIKIILNNKVKELNLENRMIYTNKEYNISFIETKGKYNCIELYNDINEISLINKSI